MADTYKILGQSLTGELALDGSTAKEVVVYEVPANTQASISAIEITNSDAANQTYKLAFVKDDEVDTAVTNVDYFVGSIENKFLAVDFLGRIAYSSNGLEWTVSSTGVSNAQHKTICIGNSKAIIASNATYPVLYSEDGVSWTQSNYTPFVDYSDSVFANDKFVLLASYSPGLLTVANSSDGINWTEHNTITSSNDVWTSITYGNGNFLAISGDGYSAVSEDGINWSQSLISSSSAPWKDVVYGGDKFVAITGDADTNVFAYSTNGINWTQGSLPSSRTWKSLAYGDGKFVIASAMSGLTQTSHVAYSSDGINWTEYQLEWFANWNSLNYLNNAFILIGSTNMAYYSSDGISWTNFNLSDISDATWLASSYGQLGTSQQLQQSVPQSLSKHIAVHNKIIEPGQTHEIKGGITLSAGDQIRAYSTSQDLIVNVYGTEISGASLNYKILGQNTIENTIEVVS